MALNVLVIGAVELCVFRGATYQDTQVGDFVEVKRWIRSGCGDGDKVCAVDTFEKEAGARIRLYRLDLDVAHLKIADVTKIQSLRRHWAKHAGIGIFVFKLWRPYGERVLQGSADVLLIDV